MKSIAVVLLVMGCMHGLLGQPVEKGVPYTLSVQRHANISQLVYRLWFTIPEQKTASITASETISFSLQKADQPLQLDFRQDAGHVQEVSVNGHTAGIQLQNEHLLIEQQWLHPGANSITIHFIAGNESLNRNNDYLYALFVPDRARTVFPCFDQPDMKAVFVLSLTVPAGWNVLANATVKDSVAAGSTATYHFNPSDRLPTYLFSFTAGKYAIAGKYNMRFLYRETDTAKIRLSVDSVFEAHKNAIQFLENWTGIPFPFQKIGFAAIPSFQFGGMEHPGEVQYNAGGLFLDDGATKDQLNARTAVISHETAHMWFGDMVTMKWFNDVWMKEVFANFMADKVTEKILGDETFRQKFLLDHTPAAYNVDRTRGANPIRQQLDNLQDAGSLYGNIIYHKAPIMMRQLELLMGDQQFRKGIQEYLQQYKYANANWNDLIAILGKHTREDLKAWNQVWVNRPGRPVFDYRFANGRLTITQKPESGTRAIWPQRFSIALFSGSSSKTIHINMKTAAVVVPVQTKPGFMVFNADGAGYGLFPAEISARIYELPGPLQRASAYINAYENLLAHRGVQPLALLDFFMQGVQKETNELNLRALCGYIGTIYWNLLGPEQRAGRVDSLEQALWNAMALQTTANNKKILFRTYQDIYMSTAAANRMLAIWQLQKAPDSVKLTEDDYTGLALTIALKTSTHTNVLEEQLKRISNPDRKARLQFLAPALSPDSVERDAFFSSLRDINNRRKEAWVATALSYLNHPLRQQQFIKWLPAALNMLEEVQQTGDVFFPQNWLGAVFSSHQSPQAWQAVQQFLAAHPHYNPKLKAKLLQATDNLYRAQQKNGR